jgi:hypothetical protein
MYLDYIIINTNRSETRSARSEILSGSKLNFKAIEDNHLFNVKEVSLKLMQEVEKNGGIQRRTSNS